MDLMSWAIKWNIPQEAIEDLMRMKGIVGHSVETTGELSEAAISNLVRKEASDKGARLWRNNLGAAHMQNGSFLRYGLANESTAVNKVIKSADLIGIQPITITQKHVGRVIGQFMSREIKKSGWSYAGTDREKAQLNWADLILSLGGNACFAVGEGTI